MDLNSIEIETKKTASCPELVSKMDQIEIEIEDLQMCYTAVTERACAVIACFLSANILEGSELAVFQVC